MKATREFYDSNEWKKVRENYKIKVGGLCENCLKKGLYNPIEAVHHKIHVTPANMHIPEIVLNEANLIGLCRECHEAEHPKRKKNDRYHIDMETGDVIIKEN